jgi:hypothetical protein
MLIAPIAAALLLLGAYNWVRFASPLETGYSLQIQPPALQEARLAGMSSLQHLPKDLYYFLIAAPDMVGGEQAPVVGFPWLVPSPWGMGIIFVAPWLLTGLWARGRTAAALATGGLVLLPGLLQIGGGWVQFGNRYSLDALPFLAGLAAIAIQQRGLQRWLPVLGVYGVLVNSWGAAWLVTFLGG